MKKNDIKNTQKINLDVYKKDFKKLEKLFNSSSVLLDFHDSSLLEYCLKGNNFYIRYDGGSWFKYINKDIIGDLLPTLDNETIVIDQIFYNVKVKHYISKDFNYNDIFSIELVDKNVFRLNLTVDPDQYLEIEFKYFEWKIFDLFDNKTYNKLYSDLYDENVKECILRNFDY